VSDGCATDQATSTVSVHAMPSAGQDGSITVCLNEPFVLWNGLSGNIDMTGTWYNASNQVMLGAQDTSGTIAGQFNYDYIVSNAYCPGDSSTVLVIVDGSCDFTASIDELANAWNVYPNPTNSLLFVEAIDVQGLVYLTDINGKLIGEKLNVFQSIELDLSNLSTGMYYLVLDQNGMLSTKRVIKN
jgi:hypothetical protein